jgi:hypothetical protein
MSLKLADFSGELSSPIQRRPVLISTMRWRLRSPRPPRYGDGDSAAVAQTVLEGDSALLYLTTDSARRTLICAVATAAAALRRGRRLGVLDAALGDRRTRSPTRTRAAAPSYFCSLTFKLGFCRLFVLLINAAILLP